MSELFWVLGGGGIGWLTGKIVGGRGYGDSFGNHINSGLDVILGIVGAYVGGLVCSWALGDGGSTLNKVTAAILVSVAFVGVTRELMRKYSLSGSPMAVRNVEGLELIGKKISKASEAWKETK